MPLTPRQVTFVTEVVEHLRGWPMCHYAKLPACDCSAFPEYPGGECKYHQQGRNDLARMLDSDFRPFYAPASAEMSAILARPCHTVNIKVRESYYWRHRDFCEAHQSFEPCPARRVLGVLP